MAPAPSNRMNGKGSPLINKIKTYIPFAGNDDQRRISKPVSVIDLVPPVVASPASPASPESPESPAATASTPAQAPTSAEQQSTAQENMVSPMQVERVETVRPFSSIAELVQETVSLGTDTVIPSATEKITQLPLHATVRLRTTEWLHTPSLAAAAADVAERRNFLLPTRCSSVRKRSKSVPPPSRLVPSTDSKATLHREPTKPISPNLKSDKRVRSASRKAYTTEEMEYMKVEMEKKEAQHRMNSYHRSYARSKTQLSSSGSLKEQLQQQPKKKLTVPKTPNFSVSKRRGSLAICKPSEEEKTGPQLKRTTSFNATKGALLQPTKIEPFEFATDKRLSASGRLIPNAAEKVLTAAEAMEKYFLDSRTHVVPANACKQITQSHSPKLQTDVRAKSCGRPRPMSRDELEMKEAEDMQRNFFRALPLDPRIFQSNGELGVPKVEARCTTEPVEFNLHLEKRASSAEYQERTNENLSAGSARATIRRPLPAKASDRCVVDKNFSASLSSTSGSGSGQQFKATVAVSPKLSGGSRASSAPARRQRPHHSLVERERQERDELAKLARDLLTEECRRRTVNPTHPEEFHLRTSARGQRYRASLETELRNEALRQSMEREVRPLPMPDLSKERVFKPVPVDRNRASIGTAEPFKLRSVERHAEAAKDRERKIASEKEQELAKAKFSAKQLPKSTYAPDMVVDLENVAPAVVPDPKIVLQSDQRAQKRKEFDEQMAKKMAELVVSQENLARQKLEEENKRIKEMRRKSLSEGGLAFRAAPMKDFNRIHAASSLNAQTAAEHKPAPTQPKSPFLQTKQRSSLRASVTAAAAAAAAAIAAIADETDENKPQKTKTAAALTSTTTSSSRTAGRPLSARFAPGTTKVAAAVVTVTGSGARGTAERVVKKPLGEVNRILQTPSVAAASAAVGTFTPAAKGARSVDSVSTPLVKVSQQSMHGAVLECI